MWTDRQIVMAQLVAELASLPAAAGIWWVVDGAGVVSLLLLWLLVRFLFTRITALLIH